MTRSVRTAVLAGLGFGLAALAGAADTPPPVLDRELFFGNPEIAGAQLSPDGQYIAFLKPWNDTRNIWVKKTAEPFDAARLVTTEKKRPIPGFFWSRDSKLILYVKDKDGDENFNVYAVDPSAANAAGQRGAGVAQPDRRQGRARATSTPCRRSARHDLRRPQRSRRRLARPLQGQDLDRASASSSARTPSASRAGTSTSTASCGSPTRVADNGDTEILKVEPEGFTKVYSCTVFETCGTEALPQGRQARLHADQQGRRRPDPARAASIPRPARRSSSSPTR